MPVKIIPFHPRYAADFKALNVAWLEKYFYVEPKDELLLGNCEESIIHPGGHIFFAELDNTIVGCFALIRIQDGIYELGKMAVDPQYQGLHIGQTLLSYGMAFAREQNWKTIILYSSRKLTNALHIYQKFGFSEVELESDNPYTRGDIKMELTL